MIIFICMHFFLLKPLALKYPQRYPYFDVVGGALRGHINPRAMLVVACATDRASRARQVKGDDPDEKGYPGPPGWGLGVGLTTPNRKNNLF
jgi:hypothetical protein